MTDNDESLFQIRFHSPDDPVIGPRGEEAKELAFPGGSFANEIEYEDRRWRFSHTENMSDPSGRKWDRLVYFEDKTESA